MQQVLSALDGALQHSLQMACLGRAPCCHQCSRSRSMTLIRKYKVAWHLLLYLALAILGTHAQLAVGKKQKSVPTNTTFPSCNTGTSRITIANLDKLPADCRPAHSYIAAAVYACFETSRVRVDNCQVRVTPTAKTAKQSPICKLMHARGDLQDSTNASLVAIFSLSKYDRFVREHPDILHSMETAEVRQVFLSTLAQLFGRAVLLQGDSNCTVSAAAARRNRHQQDHDKHISSHDATAAVTAGSAAGEHQAHNSTAAARGRKRHPGKRRYNDRLHRAGSSAAVAAPAAGAVPKPNQTQSPPGAANLTISTGNTSLPDQPAGTANSSSSSSEAVMSNSSTTSIIAVEPDDMAGSQGGRRKLLHQRQLLKIEESTAKDTLDADVEEATVAAAMPDSITANAGSGNRLAAATPAAGTVPSKPCTEEEEATEAEELFHAAVANTSSTTGNLEGSRLYLQSGDAIILQPNEQCKFQYLVTRNPSLLQPSGTPSTTAVAAGAPSKRHEKGVATAAGDASSSSSSVSWIVFSSVSAVLGVVMCYMVVKIIARRRELKDYAALKTSETSAAAPAGGDVQLVQASFAPAADQQGQQSSTSNSAGKAGSVLREQEPGDVTGLEDSSRLLKASQRSDSNANNTR